MASPGASVPASGRLAFDVIRKDRDIGDYVVTFRGSGDDVTVDIATDVKVKVPVIGVSRLSLFPDQHRDLAWRPAGRPDLAHG